jgi:hypothetical protein
LIIHQPIICNDSAIACKRMVRMHW